MSRKGHLQLSWWRLPLKARQREAQAVKSPSEETNRECLQEEANEETTMDHSALYRDRYPRSDAVGSKLSVSCPVECNGSLAAVDGTSFSGEAK
jgi:hypothetical protein